MLMEQVGRIYAQQILVSAPFSSNEQLQLLSMQVDCLSTCKGTVDVQADTITVDDTSIAVRVIMSSAGKEKTVGYLRFVRAAQSKL